MGEIRKDNLHESLIEELNDLANIDLSGKQDKTDESLLTESKDVIGAINELFQSANNGKELIANAIGEPVSSEDTFQAMSDDINSLLSTFKTNMMNNGVTVESSDKFKSLIDKIATLADTEGKGIQFAEGDAITGPAYGQVGKTLTVTVQTNLSFTPTYVFAKVTDIIAAYGISQQGTVTMISNIDTTSVNLNAAMDYIHGRIIDITSNGFVVEISTSTTSISSFVIRNWYAIGVGEEDTTLRDSLASILTEEGVSVTEEDDMASLISKVDSEFSDKENEITNLETELEGKVSPAGTAVASDVLSGKTFINSTGELITGTNISYTFSNDTNSNFMYLVYSRLSDVQISMWRGGTNTLHKFTAPFSGTICFSLYGATYTSGNYGPYFYIYDATTDTLLTDEYHIFSDSAPNPAIRHVTANVTKGHSIELYAAPQGSATVHIFYYYGFQVHYPMS